jgi:hypothetical protein
MADKLPVQTEQYKGKPMLKLPMGTDGRWFFSFGISKARKILEYLPEIQTFVNQHGSNPNGKTKE